MKRTKIASEALSEPELSAVLNAALPDPRLYRMILLAVTHGLRAEELCKLRPGDVSGGFLLIRHFKTKEVDQHSLTPEEKCLLSTWIPASPLSLFGMPYATFYYKFRGLAERCALPQSKQSPHCLRHTCIKRAIARGIPIPAVQRFVRHSTLAATSRYTKFSTLEACELILG